MNPYLSYKEEELAAAVRKADFGAYEELVHRKTAELYRISSALTREYMEAKQLLQHTIAAVWHECRKQRDQEMDVSLLLMQTLLIQDKKRRIRSGQNLSSMEATPMEVTSMKPEDAEESPSASLPVKQMISQRSRQIEGAVDQMPISVRQVFLLTYLAEIDSSDIALYIGKTEEVTAQRLQQALRILARELGEKSEDISPSLLRKHFEEERDILLLNLDEERWESAVQLGLLDAREGKKPSRGTKHIAGWSISAVIAVLVVTLFVLHPWAPKTHKALNQEGTLVVPDLSFMMETGEENNLVKEKIDSGDYVELGQAMETDNGVRLILDAAMDFGREKLFWYTLEKGELHHIPFITRGEIMDASETDYIGGLQGTNGLTSESDSSSKGMMLFTKNESSLLKSTEGALIKFVIETREDQRNRTYSLSTPYPELPEEEAKHVMLDGSFTVEGQSFELTELIMTPEYTQVRLKPGPENRYSIDSLDSVTLETATEFDGRGYSMVESGASYLLFPSIYYEEFDHLQLSMGETLANLDPVLVVDTDKNKIISSPSDSVDVLTELSVDHSTIEDGYFTVHFPNWEGIEYGVSNQYEDAAGNSYFVQDIEYSAEGRPASLKLNDFSHVQPLTFHLTSYSDSTDVTDHVRIAVSLIGSTDNVKE